MNRIKVSDNFYLDEFQDRNTGEVKIDERLIIVLQEIRNTIGKPIIITSGYRTMKTHIEIYKKKYGDHWEDKIPYHSKHLKGLAVDMNILGGNYLDYMTAIDIAKKSGVIKGIGNGIKSGFIHLDTRNSNIIIEWKY